MMLTDTTTYKPTELDNNAAWSAYQRAGVAAISQPITLRSGKTITMRAIRPDDAQRLQTFHSGLSSDTIAMRYFRAAPVLYDREAWHLTHLDYDNRMALVATTGEGADERIIAVVRYERVTASEAEMAFVVEDCWQGQGISTTLLARLLSYAKARGFERMMAVTLATNMRMRAVLAHAGHPFTSHYADGCLTLTLDLRQAE